MNPDHFFEPVGTCQHQLKVKASRFIAELFPVKNEDEIQSYLNAVKKREYTANHHCFAWRLGLGDQEVWRVNDDGEPAGTAGKPIYLVLSGAEITNVLAVVTRYFGGTKLGKGGLIHAYGGVVREALPLLKKKAYIQHTTLECHCNFELANLVYRLIDTYGASLKDQNYADGVTIKLLIKSDQADAFAWELHELSNGQIKATPS